MRNVLKVKRLVEGAKMPYRAHEGDAGLDVFSVEAKTIGPGESELIRTGISLGLPAGTEAQIRPRSGLALKHSVTVLNSPGTIDEGYRGELKIILINHGRLPVEIDKGMRIAQMIIAPVLQVQVQEAEELESTERGTGGFGSSGK